MKYRIFQSSRFRKSLKRMLARGKDGAKLEAVVAKLANGELVLTLTDTGTHADLF